MTALAAVRKQAPANVIVQGQFQNVRDRQTPYIAFFTDRPSYLAGDGLMQTRNQPIDDRLSELGVMPLPPYIHAPLADPNRYQTVYAQTPGSAATPPPDAAGARSPRRPPPAHTNQSP